MTPKTPSPGPCKKATPPRPDDGQRSPPRGPDLVLLLPVLADDLADDLVVDRGRQQRGRPPPPLRVADGQRAQGHGGRQFPLVPDAVAQCGRLRRTDRV